MCTCGNDRIHKQIMVINGSNDVGQMMGVMTNEGISLHVIFGAIRFMCHQFAGRGAGFHSGARSRPTASGTAASSAAATSAAAFT